MTRKELLAYPKREWDEELHEVLWVWVIPNRKKHESGWECMDFVATFKDKHKEHVRFGGYCDVVRLEGEHFVIDCDYPSGIIRISNSLLFSVSKDLSTIYFREQK